MFIATNYKLFLITSAVIIGLAFGVIFVLGLPLGIDFTGGALTEVAYGESLPEDISLTDFAYGAAPEAEVESALTALSFDLGGVSVRQTETDDHREGYIIRTRDLSEPERIEMNEALLSIKDNGEIIRFTSIGPVIGQELKDKAVWAIGAVVLVIILYVAFAFRSVSYPVGSWMYGGITILALAHDVIIPTAVMALLGYFAGAEVDVLFVMAILAVLGYSVNDTIVVFDRVRENLIKFRQEKKRKVKKEGGITHEEVTYTLTKPLSKIVGESVSQTLTRSINTSVTTFVALLALYMFGGDTTETFALILMVGVVAGTYSSIFLANTLLIWVGERKLSQAENTK